ncbi:hypothetical protein MB02_10610 [Croceicoccus estronivorus]|uniref:hypothetical protein n=1 Tax=Croceicoccus estronivorus TaxID=1172626 RepID=UPI00082E628F|nr:hypothetical protein [Croceicoccus estronivorus]OCC23613.1 hypothetical protein MB02_10610 [Croceicoccus estronivorus]
MSEKNAGRQEELLIGISDFGIMHTVPGEFPIDQRFRMVQDANVFDYIDKTPEPHEITDYRDAVQRHGIPLTAGGYYYVLGKDEQLLRQHLELGREFGARVHNVQVLSRDSQGELVTDEQIAEIYLDAMEWGSTSATIPCFEVHVGMWSEQFSRVQRVAELVERRGLKFNITLDHSHIVFAIRNRDAQETMGIRSEVEAGAITLDPFSNGNICRNWIEAGLVRHAHARSAVPNGPRNQWMAGLDGRPGLALQYPFIRPNAGQWHSEWDESLLETWKFAISKLLQHHANTPGSRLGTISTEFIPFADYGGGAKYSLFENNIACATWIRAEWERLSRNELTPPATNGSSSQKTSMPKKVRAADSLP